MADGRRRMNGNSGQGERRRTSARQKWGHQRERRIQTEIPSVIHFLLPQLHAAAAQRPPSPKVVVYLFLSRSGRSVRLGSRIQVGRFFCLDLGLGLGGQIGRLASGRHYNNIRFFYLPILTEAVSLFCVYVLCVCVCVSDVYIFACSLLSSVFGLPNCSLQFVILARGGKLTPTLPF